MKAQKEVENVHLQYHDYCNKTKKEGWSKAQRKSKRTVVKIYDSILVEMFPHPDFSHFHQEITLDYSFKISDYMGQLPVFCLREHSHMGHKRANKAVYATMFQRYLS